MSEMIKIWLIEMLSSEIKETNANIANNVLWARGSTTPDSAENFANNISELEDYKSLLFKMKRQLIEKGSISI